MPLNFEHTIGLFAISCAGIRGLVAWRRREQPSIFLTFCLLTFFAGLSLGTGMCMIPYPYLPTHMKKFYLDWPNNPITILFAGLAYLLVGIVGNVYGFRRQED